jgi:precorrin-6Y C5,15-methyltransferase (decarboxylating)
MENNIFFVGMGSGEKEYILPAAYETIKKCDFVVASSRFEKVLKSTVNQEKIVMMTDFKNLFDNIFRLSEKGNVAVCVSGDPLMYSLYKTFKNKFPEKKAKIIAGIGSIQIFASKIGITMENSKIISIHGRDYKNGQIALEVAENEKIFFFCSEKSGPLEIAEILKEYKLENTEIFVGENLTYENEKIYSYTPDTFPENYNNPKLCVALVLNKKIKKISHKKFLSDDDFIRNKTPMTKQEVRHIILGKMQAEPDSVIWDIGAGTGSISIECARMCSFGKVYAIEYKKDALEILKKNKEFFGTENLEIIDKRASCAIDFLPEPDIIFIGGTDGEINEIFEKIEKSSKKIKIIMSAVTLETQSVAVNLMKKYSEFEASMVSVSNTKEIGKYTIFESNNPVMIYSCVI